MVKHDYTKNSIETSSRAEWEGEKENVHMEINSEMVRK
jgi:hypothetical protein